MAVADLAFKSRYGKIPLVDEPGAVVLRGEVEWLVAGSEAAIVSLLAVVSGIGERTSPQSAILKFGNIVGTFHVGNLGAVRVVCGKWGEEVFDAMLADLTEQTFALPFSATQAAGLPHDRSIANRDDVRLHAFLYARRVLLATEGDQSLVRALEEVVRDPHRRFRSGRTTVSLASARRIDPRTITRIAEDAKALVRAPGHLAHTRLAQQLRGHLPQHVEVSQVEHSFDTAENRFVLEFIKQLRALVDRVGRMAEGKATHSAFWTKAVEDCDAMKRVLRPFERHDVWIGVRSMDHVPLGSTVLQRRRGYKDVLHHYLTMRAAARIPLDKKTVENAVLGLKDVATLYELWCYFAVVDAMGNAIGRDPDTVEEFRAKFDKLEPRRGFRVSWAGGPTVHYNASFSAHPKEKKWLSASLPLRPDIVIEIDRAGRSEFHVFDAKLRVNIVKSSAKAGAIANDGDESNAEDYEDEDVDDEPSPEEASTSTTSLSFKRDDVVKMHAYRDALPLVRSARVLYPGNKPQAFHSLESGATAIDMVGAIPLVPGKPSSDLDEALASILGKESAMASMSDDEPTAADLAAVAELLADIQRVEAQPIEWGGGKQADGSIQMPFVVYAPEAEHLIRAIYDHHLIVFNFDWSSWQDDAQRFLDPDVVDTASLDDVRRLLTLHVRQDRFVEGHFAEMIALGHIAVLLRRLGELARATPSEDNR